MRLLDVLLCLLCVALGSAGQVLLRAASLKASQMQVQGFAAWMHGTTVLALVLYGAGMLLWLWVLARVPITQAFAFFGLSFIAVPLLAHHWLGDPLTPHVLVGGVVILAGIALTHWPAS